MDYQGKWYPATIVAVEPATRRGEQEEQASNNEEDEDKSGPNPPTTSIAPIAKVKVHFHNFASKWDEWYDVDSTRLCPPGSVIGNKSSSKFSPLRPKSSRVSQSFLSEALKALCLLNITGMCNVCVSLMG